MTEISTAHGHYAAIINALREDRFADAEREATAEVRKARHAAQGWTLLGEALLHQGFGAAAGRVFHRAWLLDPEASWVEQARQAVGRSPQGPPRPDIEELLAVPTVTVAIGIIARDEERSIRRCLASLVGAADEIVLIDCESKDATVAIAREFSQVKVVHTTWQRDFAALRNEGLAHMTSDWVLWVDADEHLHPDDKDAVREAAGLYNDFQIPAVLYIWQVNQMQGAIRHEFSQTRMFPLRFGLRYHGRVHEQVVPAHGDMFAGSTYRKPVRIRLLHDGYEPDIVAGKRKLSRNLELLQLMVEEEPDNPGWWLFYGRESLAMGRTEQALRALRQAEQTAALKPSFARLPDVWMLQAQIHLAAREWDTAEQLCQRCLEHAPDFPDAQFYLGLIRLNRGAALYREAEGLLRQSKESFSRYRGTVTPDHEIMKWKADVSLADIARSVGKFADAALLYRDVQTRCPYVTQVEKPLKLLEEQLRKLDRFQKSGE